MNFLHSMYLLQAARFQDFSMGGGRTQQNNTPAIVVMIAIIVIVIIVLAVSKKGGAGGGGKRMSYFALNRMARNIGLNYEQIRMLNFAFKTDDVTDPYRSLISPVLLDTHFRRAYRVIEQNSTSPAETLRKHAILFSTRNILENSAIGKISNTKQLKEDTVLTLSTGREKINVNVVYTQGENLVVETPKNVLGSQIKIAKGTKLSVLFFTKSNKGFTFETRVTGYSTMHGRPVMQLAHSNSLRFLSQRRFRRRHAGLACFMNLVYVEGTKKKQRLVVDKRRLSGTMVDISVGGCSIKTSGPVQVGARLKIEFTQGENNIAALGQVLRSNKTGISTIIHVKFLRVTQKSMNMINAFVYEYSND